MTLSFRHLFFASAFVLVAVACSGSDDGTYLWRDEWDKNAPVTPDVPDEPDEPQLSYKGKPRVVWIDAAANFVDYANDEAKIASDVKRIAETGFTHVVVDVRPTNTGVLFKSSTEHALDKVDVWNNGYRWVTRTASFDYLKTFIEEGHKNGLTVFASMNTFVGGTLCPYGLGEDGILYRNPSLKPWASVVNTADGLKNTLDLTGSDDTGAKFLSPANDEVQEYLLKLIGELAAYDGLDGVILDRCRFDDYSLQSDFSDASREKFEAYLGSKVANWPADVMSPGQSSFNGSTTSMQKSWLSFRAKTIHDFVAKAADKVHTASGNNCKFGVYVGGWYSSYYYSGVNWASPKYDPKAAGYYWADGDYKNYGYADHCDVMIIGAYAAADKVYGSGEWSMQGFCKQAGELIKGDATYFGGPDIGNSSGFESGGQGARMPQIVDACMGSADGLFIFDLCHVKMYDYWNDFKKAFDEYLAASE